MGVKRGDGVLILLRHFLTAPSTGWTIDELRICVRIHEKSLYRAVKKLRDHKIIIKSGTVYMLNADIIGSLRTNIVELQKQRDRSKYLQIQKQRGETK